MRVIAALQHAGSQSHGYEDAYYPTIPGSVAAAIVADGATQGCRSQLLAEAVVAEIAARPAEVVSGVAALDGAWLAARRRWFRSVLADFNTMRAEEQDRFERGGATTLLGVVAMNPGRYRLFWVGDCFAFWLRHEQCIRRLPEDVEVGGIMPDVLNTQDRAQAGGLPQDFVTRADEIAPLGDTLVLTTDALGAYLDERKDEPGFWKEWLDQAGIKARDQERFIAWANSHRDAGNLASDDYTAVVIEFPEDEIGERVPALQQDPEEHTLQGPIAR